MDMRRPHYLFIGIAIAALAAVAAGQPQVRPAGPYRFLKEIPVGGEGGWDYLAVDPGARRLYVTHATKVVVINLDTDAVVGEISGTQGAHGCALAPELGLGFISDGRESRAAIVDLKTLKITAKVETGGNPDAILYVPVMQEVYTFNRNRQAPSATVFEAKSGKVVATVPLPGTPEFAVLDAKAGRIYNNIDSRNEVAVIDIKTHRIVAEWPTAPGEGGSGMAIDLENHRLFIGCDNVMVMMDSSSGKVVATVPIASGVDADRFDSVTKLAFASCGAGSVTIAREETSDKLTVVQTLETARGARTMALDPKTHRIYLSTADYEPAPANAPAGGRPRPVPGSFKVLVYGMDVK